MSTMKKIKVASVVVAIILLTLLIVIGVKTIMAAALIAKVCGIVSLIGAGTYFFIRWRR